MSIAIENRKIRIGDIKDLWRKNHLQLDIPIIDMHHIWLIYLILVLENDLKLGNFKTGNYNFHQISSELITFTINNFAIEEEIIKKFKYPQMNDHFNQHTLFVNYIKENTVVGKIKKLEVIEDTIFFLKNWLNEHIKIEDRSFVDYTNKNGQDINKFVKRLIDNDYISLKVTEKQKKLYYYILQKKFDIKIESKDIVSEVIKFWKTYKLGIGIPILNMQNLWLVKLMIELEYSFEQKNPLIRKDILRRIFREVEVYYREHFDVEESILRGMNFPGKIEHFKKHDDIKELIHSHKKQMETNKEMPRELAVTLKNWLVSHVSFEDKKFKKLYSKNKESVTKFVKQKIIDKKFIIHPEQLNLYSVIKVMLEAEAEG
ncbi:MAG: hemerythrin family protein [Leptospiraceae bacterium]|nr:hemerythrin family protein [Leptospiraceae bacterium]MCP5513125.1 hemerythrin family protein [Leptospiraceae bacterium]